MRRSLVTLALLAVLAAGCGQATQSSVGDFQGEERGVAQLVEDLQTAGERKDPDKICTEILAPELRTRIARTGRSCPDEMQRAIDDADDFELVVQDVTVTGTQAQATIERREGQRKQTAIFRFVKVGPRWRATSLGAGA